MHRFVVGRLGDRGISPDLIRQVFELRHHVFHERLQWDVRSTNGQERDEFDDDATVYIIAKDIQTGRVEGCWRLRPTTGPYMLKNIFPGLLHGQPAPEDECVWEVSRFAVVNASDDGNPYGFSELTQDLVAKTVEYGVKNGITAFVWVCSTAVERLSLRLGYQPKRLGEPMLIGTVRSVASKISIDKNTSSIAAKRLYPDLLKVAA